VKDNATTTPASAGAGIYTVVGFWSEEGWPVAVGVIAGQHEVTGGEDYFERGLWATTAAGADAEEAEGIAVEAMIGTADDDGEPSPRQTR